MKRMSMYLLAFFAALAVCGWLVHRRLRNASVPTEARPLDRLQGGVRIERGGNYAADGAAKQRLLEKLQEQERRQRPQEGRN